MNPYLVEGKKTCGLEIGESSSRATRPDWVVVALGDGCTTAGIWKGMREMHELGVLPRLPRILAVQADGAAPLAKAWAAKNYGNGKTNDYEKVKAQTAADSIAVGEPRNWRKALRAVKASEGAIVAVSDESILEAARDIAASTGVFAEPTGSAPLAGIARARETGVMTAKDRVLVVVTGNGPQGRRRGREQGAPPAHRIGVSLDDVARVLRARQEPKHERSAP